MSKFVKYIWLTVASLAGLLVISIFIAFVVIVLRNFGYI